MNRCWDHLRSHPRHWLVTGAAGFIGSHLIEALLRLDQEVTGLDDFRSGHRSNLENVRQRVVGEQWDRFRFREGDITRRGDVVGSMAGVQTVLHHAALGSVPASLEDPAGTHTVNVTGFLEILIAARAAGVHRVVYASSSAVYGDAPDSPAREGREGQPLSPYALSKALNESYASLFERCYRLESVGLRYFNVFGPRQDPRGAYAAVIPRWIAALLEGRPVEIYGDGDSTRDFCPVANVVEANLLAATGRLPSGGRRVFNIGLGRSTTLNHLADVLRTEVGRGLPSALASRPRHLPFRPGDVRHSCADVRAAADDLGFREVQSLEAGLGETVAWFAENGDSARIRASGPGGPAYPGPATRPITP